MEQWQQRSGAYMQVQGTRPQTIGQSLVDSPSGLLAWIVEKFQEWTDPAAKLPEDAVDCDRILTDVSIYWFTATAASAAHTYRQRSHHEGSNSPAAHEPNLVTVNITAPVSRLVTRLTCQRPVRVT